MKTVATFSQPAEGQVLWSRLESSGIKAYLRDENMASLDAIGGIKIDVADEDYEKAMEFIAAD